eukprot:1176006-Prorocentrum_minimum.AAC.3
MHESFETHHDGRRAAAETIPQVKSRSADQHVPCYTPVLDTYTPGDLGAHDCSMVRGPLQGGQYKNKNKNVSPMGLRGSWLLATRGGGGRGGQLTVACSDGQFRSVTLLRTARGPSRVSRHTYHLQVAHNTRCASRRALRRRRRCLSSPPRAPTCAAPPTSRGPIGGGTRGYTRGGDQSEERQEDIPGAGTNRRRDKRIYPGVAFR